ncbi:MAG: hypothetical protein FWH46_02000, partial [Methanimicrococcus sp.]|nr:hypothetical protein [Methanimicrococcus sp.]
MTLKKLLPFIPAASIFFILILAFAVPIQAAGNIDYLDANGALKTSPAAIDYTGQTSMGTINTTTWYVVTDVQAPEDRIIIAGNVNLILTDSSYLNASRGGIEVQGTNSLTIYAQSVGTGRGRLAAHGTPNSSGIGGSDGNDGGTITITGGTISAFGDEFGAGIGG